MMLKTSSRKINPFFGMIKSNLRKNFGIVIVLCIIALLFCPGVYLVNLDSFFANRYTQARAWGATPSNFSETFGIIIAIFAPLFVILFNFVNFSFLYKKSSSDVFHAFPITRTELLLSRMITSIISALTPIVLCTIFYSILVLFNPWLGHFGTLLYYLILTLIITLLWSAFSMIFVVCSGSAFDLTFSFFSINISIMIVGLILSSIFNGTLLGYTGSSGQLLERISLPFFSATHETVGFWIRAIVYIAVFTVVAILLYNRRKAERGGTAYAYKFMYYVCSVLISICGGYVIGILFFSDIFSLGFWFFTLIGAILFALIYGLITNRGFRGALRSLIMGAIAWAVLLAVMLTSTAGGLGFTKRVPNAFLVKDVTVSVLGEDITFTDPDIVIKLHEKTIESAISYSDYSEIVHEDEILYGNYSENELASIKFDYTLVGGSTLQRRFYVPVSSIGDELLAVFKHKDHLKYIVKDLKINKYEPQKIEITYYPEYENGYNFIDYEISKDDLTKLLSAYWKDLQTIETIDKFNWNNNSLCISVTYEDTNRYISLYMNDEFYNTIEMLKYHYLY